jgi:hypothetical protein
MREQAGRQFDPRLLDAFLQALPEVIDVMSRFSDDEAPGPGELKAALVDIAMPARPARDA